MRRALLLVLVAVMAVGCHAQVPPTAHSVALKWTAPSSGGTPPYTYIVSRITVASATSICPTADVAAPNYTPLNSASPVSSLAYTDSAASGLNVCYIVQAKDTASAIGNPSNSAGPFVVPTVPGIPGTPNGTVADLKQPPLPLPAVGYPASPVMVYYTTGTLKGAEMALKDAQKNAPVLTGRVR